MAAIGDLVVRLGAQTQGFDRGMRKAQSRIGRFRGAVGKLGGKLRGLGGIFLGISAGGMAAMIKSQLDTMDSTGKLADRIGISTERLQGLRYAAELTGAGTETLDAGLQTMAKRLGEAARGAGAAKPALEHLGLSAEQLVNLRADEQFRRIADAIAKIPSPTQRAALAANIFSKGNMELVNTLAEGSAGLDRMQREAEGLGLAFSRDAAAKAEKANDALSRLGGAIKGSVTGAVADLADQIRGLAEAMSKIPGAARSVRAALLRGMIKFYEAAPFPMEQGFLESLRESAERLERGESLTGPSRAREEKRRKARAAGFGAGRFEKAEERRAAIDRANERARERHREMLAEAQRRWERRRRQQQEQRRQARLRQSELAARGQAIARQFETPAERFRRQMAEINRLAQAGALGRVAFERAARGYREQFEQARRLGKPQPEPEGPTQFAGAALRGSREAYSRIVAAMGRAGPQKETAKNTKGIRDDVREMKRDVQELARAEGHEIPPS